jgi:hypothetical protein
MYNEVHVLYCLMESLTYPFFGVQSVFPNPEMFNPDRFLVNGKPNPDVPNPVSMTFGYGKRWVPALTNTLLPYQLVYCMKFDASFSMCPGRQMALRTLWNTMAAVLSLYDIGHAFNEYGEPILPPGEFTASPLRYDIRIHLSFPPSLHVIPTGTIGMSSPDHDESVGAFC